MKRFGFTLIELLLVFGIIGILAAVVIIAINPAKQLGDARDAQRRLDVDELADAIKEYAIDNNGAMPCQFDSKSTPQTPCIDAGWRMIGGDRSTEGNTDVLKCSNAAISKPIGAARDDCTRETIADDCLNLGGLTGSYLVNLPVDPKWGSGDVAGAGKVNAQSYYIVRSVDSRITVRACFAEGEEVIEETR